MNRDQNLKSISIYIDRMPSLPTSVSKVVEICNDPKASPSDLNQVISLDPVLMARVMKLINSAYYGISQRITSLVRAIIMLGLNTVKNLALSTAVMGNLKDPKHFHALNMDGYWRHSICVGVTAKIIARHAGVSSKMLEEYFIAGLLHDIGKIPMNNRLSDEYVAAMSLSDREHSPLHKAEMKVMEISHEDAGEMIVKSWKLGDEILDAVKYHHEPANYSGPHIDIVYSVSLANYFANFFEIGFSGDRYPERPANQVFEHFKITLEWLEEIEDKVNAEIERARIFLNLN